MVFWFLNFLSSEYNLDRFFPKSFNTNRKKIPNYKKLFFGIKS